MKVIMSTYRNEMCDHYVELTTYCGRCESQYRTPARRWISRLHSVVVIIIAALRSL